MYKRHAHETHQHALRKKMLILRQDAKGKKLKLADYARSLGIAHDDEINQRNISEILREPDFP